MEIGFNDNRMYFADLISQPDHSMATIIGIRDYGIANYKNWIWGLEWTNLMITYSVQDTDQVDQEHGMKENSTIIVRTMVEDGVLILEQIQMIGFYIQDI